MRTWILLPALAAGCAPPAPESRPLRDYRGVIHVHSFHSHDSRGTYEEILAACRKRGIDFVCMTDHPPKDDPGRPLREGWRGLREGVLFIQGAEYSNNVLAIGIREPIAGRGRQERIDAVRAQGGVAIVCHPEEVGEWDFDGYDGIEIWNTHAAFEQVLKNPARAAKILKKARKDPAEAFLEILERPSENLRRWDELNGRRRVTGVAGNDAHQNVRLGGVQLDPYDVALGFVTTHVLAEELTEEAILRALREGRAYVAFELVAPTPTGPMSKWPGDRRTVRGHGWEREEIEREGKPWIFTNPTLMR